jgi:crotonobetainyl-CoA:carnitine CoA-transferase CaiB-like acyl-CoA transferase
VVERPQPKFPALGEHTEAIMQELGFSSDEIPVIEQQKDLAGVS